MDIEEDKEYEDFKNRYLQRPITFLTEENLDKLEDHCRKAIRYERGVEHKVVLELLERYKEFLAERENDKKKIKNLEEKNKEILNSRIGIDLSYDDYIPKQKVEEEIEALRKMFKATMEGKLQEYTPEEIIIKRNTLKELLEDK